VVIFDQRARAARPLEVGADVAGGHAVQHGFDKGAITTGTCYCGTDFVRAGVYMALQKHKTCIVIVSGNILHYEYKHTYYEDNTYRD